MRVSQSEIGVEDERLPRSGGCGLPYGTVVLPLLGSAIPEAWLNDIDNGGWMYYS
ncbi:predicted protein [Plenodomus lingam JN3]|uniref:Predicted protein n=1 Tax=Leptosphaeria maculans (strain JN3 / isolate v23.1.3 / race Av1-4-5-6-7-8) TaxID=985895 RepID=E5A983_LEPMJ|nr:predicted protein [Plenodomus lingam JN3]CBY00224.1 predicted protein [Plenodomus lingam JN3]